MLAAKGLTTNTGKTKVIGYIRVSKDDQVRSGLGLEDQKQKLKAYSQLYDLELIGTIVDPGASAKSLKRRPGLDKALKMLKSGKASAVLVAKLDRLTRSVKDLGYLLDEYFSDKGFSLLSVAENIDTRSAVGRLVVNVLGSVAQWERETISERTKDALAVKRRRGEKIGTVPYGKREVAGKLVTNDREDSVMKEIARLKASNWSVRAIAKRLRSLGIRSRTGELISKTQVHRIMKRAP